MHVKPKQKPANWLRRLVILGALGWAVFFWRGGTNMTILEHGQDFLTGDDWDGWVYPLGSDYRAVKVGNFDTYNDCMVRVHTYVAENFLGWDTVHYECGYECEAPKQGDEAYICAAIRD
jgi:hypothetical protein